MTRQTFSTPTPSAPLLIGLLVDVSGSMTTAIQNRSGKSLNRLEAFQKSLGELAHRAKAISSDGPGAGAVRLFAYGFGFGNPLAMIFGRSGPAVRDLLKLDTRDSLVSIEDLADDWQRYESNVRSLAIEMFGATPMVQGFEIASARFQKEQKRQQHAGKLLFVLSDGDPTDGDMDDVVSSAHSLQDEETLIISCYVTSEDITAPRVLYNSPDPKWPKGASLMFECSSTLPSESVFQAYLTEHHWKFQKNSKLFSQINQSEVLAEFLNLLLSPLQPQDAKSSLCASSSRVFDATGTCSPIFISYSHKDSDWLNRLRIHLKPLERQDLVDIWDDSRISIGDDWYSEIAKAIDHARIAVLLISADFLASDFIANSELPSLLEAAHRRGLTVVPVLVEPSRFEFTPELSRFQSL
ncbi:MAG: hypothetical protein QG588_2133, partial [Candidatus Poribacteria bacterium]|nr:hypothetical protein [Candidatus Poribacteria bacterium]